LTFLANIQVGLEVGLLDVFQEFCLTAYEGVMRKGVWIGGGGGVDENLFERDFIWIDCVKGVEPTIRGILIESELE
jgi:hypothetical protein